MVNRAFKYLRPAGAAGAVAAAVRQDKTGVERGFEQDFAIPNRVVVAARLQGDLIRHEIMPTLGRGSLPSSFVYLRNRASTFPGTPNSTARSDAETIDHRLRRRCAPGPAPTAAALSRLCLGAH